MEPDTLPRWEVFKQDAPGKPHQAVGSVHAASSRHALLSARSVFARRPSAVSLWVAPADEITSRTAEELAANPPVRTDAHPAEREPYLAFRKASARRSMIFTDYVGAVAAASPEDALARALAEFPEPPALVWWVLPARSILQSDPDDQTVESWFAPAKDKTYKQQSAYGTVGGRRGE